VKKVLVVNGGQSVGIIVCSFKEGCRVKNETAIPEPAKLL
jgi:hypothetical protein